jgi:RNA polymerase sigma factor (sigma-70 family)
MATGLDLPHLEEMLARARNGDSKAENELFDYVLKRFEVIVTHIYRVPARADVSRSDVIQEGCLRLVRLLRDHAATVESAQHLLLLAGQHLRWALVEQLRKWKPGLVKRLRSKSAGQQPPASPSTSPEQLELWERFHTLIDADGVLEPKERAVFTLRWYQGLSQKEIASTLQVSERTVKRYWKSAKDKLKRHLPLDLFK